MTDQKKRQRPTHEEIENAIGYSHNFATAKPAIDNTEKEHILGLCALLERAGKAMSSDAGMIMEMTRDIVSVGETLGIPGEEQEGGVGEFIEAIEQMKKAAQKPLGERSGIVLNGYQLKEALDCLAPDDDPLQLECELVLLYGDDTFESGPGLYAYHEGYPEEGVCKLVGDVAEQAEQPSGTTSDQYRAELYDEVWHKASCMGYGNVTEALVALERVKEQDEQQSTRAEQIMEQAQVFASAWALVGSSFDTGDGLKWAKEEKERLRTLLGGEA